MLYKRTNKAGNTVELLSVGDVSFMRAKLDDKLYKTLLILKSGEIVHVNLTQLELDGLVSKIESSMDGAGQDKKIPELAKVAEKPKQLDIIYPTPPSSIDDMIDELTDETQADLSGDRS